MVYVDGFNLYFGALKKTPYKWLDPVSAVMNHLSASHSIVGKKYFTAKLHPRPHDPNQPLRQLTYLRALKTLPAFDIYFGCFLTRRVRMPLAESRAGKTKYALVLKTEEKGSDVNLGAQLLHDGHLGRYECAVVVSGDSDLVMPVRLVREALQLPVGVLNPQKNPCVELKKYATFYKHIKKGRLAQSQFPQSLRDNKGCFHKPNNW
jgi:hypothetical protein